MVDRPTISRWELPLSCTPLGSKAPWCTYMNYSKWDTALLQIAMDKMVHYRDGTSVVNIQKLVHDLEEYDKKFLKTGYPAAITLRNVFGVTMDVVASGNVARQDMRTLLVPLQCIDRLVSILDPSLRVSATVQRQMNRRECGADALKILVGSSNWIKLIVDAVKVCDEVPQVEVLGETEEANELLSWLGSMNRASDGRSRIISNLGAAGKALGLILMGGSFGVNATAIAEYAQVISRKRGLRIAESDIITTIGTVNNPPRFWTALAFALASSSITLLWPNNQLASCASASAWGLQEHWMDLGNSHLADSNSLFFQLDRLVWASVYEIAVGKQTAVNALYSMCRSPLFVQACTLEGRESNDLETSSEWEYQSIRGRGIGPH
ncbi:hypothetical protein B0H10DRAFT_2044916 [Mycena sp. CBHHK59/15]|nr:hypothetical protein B0H10DRAFT_2044916 [Mycena sp. CBHHK59/15]